MPYYMLFTRPYTTHKWAPQFGDYTRKDVEQERRDSFPRLAGKLWRIVRLADDHQNTLDAVTREINGDQ